MRIGAFIQARMNSARLPGKVLAPICGKPLLAYVFERLERLKGLDFFVLVTSNRPTDDPLREFCREHGVAIHCGPLDDVAGRFIGAYLEHECSGLLRYCADSPFVDMALMAEAIALFRKGGWDLVTNIHPRTFPPGQSVEIIASDVLAGAHCRMDSRQREHCTAYFYEKDATLRVCNITAPIKAPSLNLSVDTADDLERAEAIVSRMDRPHWEYGWQELVRLAQGEGVGSCV